MWYSDKVLDLKLEDLQQALACLYHSNPPETEPLKSLREEDWNLLGKLLADLLKQRNENPLH